MKGLSLARAYFQEILHPIILTHRPDLAGGFAAGLLGWGSDVLGHDDSYSQDHEWGPRCLIFLAQERVGERDSLLKMLDQQVPARFRGFPTRFALHPLDPMVRVPSPNAKGSLHVQVTTCEDYWRHALGVVEPATDLDWLAMSEHRLLELTRGDVFHDGPGTLTRLRDLYATYPLDVWKYRLAFAWQALGWDADLIGLTAARDDTLSARQCASACLRWVVRLAFLLNRTYAPHYLKWVHREFLRLPLLARDMATRLEAMCTANDASSMVPGLEALCESMLACQGNLGLLPPMELREPPHGRGFFSLDLQVVADQIQASIEGQLQSLPLIGAADQWTQQYDILLDAESLRSVAMAAQGRHWTTR